MNKKKMLGIGIMFALVLALFAGAAFAFAFSSTYTRGLTSYYNGSSTPAYRAWNGTNFSSQSDAIAVDGNPQWVVVKASNAKDEKLMGTLTDTGVVNVQEWSGESSVWSNSTNMTTVIGTTNDAYQGFDIAYETNSSRAIIVYNNNTQTPAYRIWNGTHFSAEGSLQADSCGGIPVWIIIVSHPTTDEIIEVDLDTNGDFCAQVWNGSGWTNARTLDTAGSIYTYKFFDAAYEQSSGDVLITWQGVTDGQLRYNTLVSGTWGTTADAGTDLGSDLTWVDAAAMNSTDRVMIGFVEGTNDDVNAMEWNGTAWGTTTAIDTTAEESGDGVVSVSYIGSTGNAMLVYVDNDFDYPSYMTCAGAANCFAGTWSAAAAIPGATNCGEVSDIDFVALGTDKFTNRIMFTATSQANHYKCASEYDGSSWGTWNANLASGSSLATGFDFGFAYDNFKDFSPPDVTDLAPAAGTEYNDYADVEIQANATDVSSVDTVLANITWNGGFKTVVMTDPNTDGRYNYTFSNVVKSGRNNITIVANDTHGNVNNTETTYFEINDTTPPRVLIIHPWGICEHNHHHDEYEEVDITLNVTDLTEVDAIIANVTDPNGTSYLLSNWGYGLQSDDFETDTEGTNWAHANVTSAGQTCFNDIDGTAPGKMFFAIDGGTGPSTTHCAYNSIERANGNFDLNLTFNITYMEDDSFFTLRSAPTDNLAGVGIRVYISVMKQAGGIIYRFAYNNGTDTTQQNIPNSETEGKLRIKRSNMTGTPFFNLYYLNSTDQKWIDVFGNTSLPGSSRTQYIQLKPGAEASNFGKINLTVDNFLISGDNLTFALFNQTSLSGRYNLSITANDTLGYVNDTETSYFNVSEVNDAPSRPFFEEPDVGDIVSGLFNISWGQVFDEEGDNLQFNITLLNPNNGTNATIVSYYGNASNTWYEWNTSNHTDGHYGLRILVFENETTDKLSNSDTLSGNFTIDHVSPTVQLNYPGGGDTVLTSINFNWTTTDNLDTAPLCNLTINGTVNASDITSQNGIPTNYTVSGLPGGLHDWNVTCWDNGGNTNTSETRTFYVDTLPPQFNTSETRPIQSSQYNQTQIIPLIVKVNENLTVFANVSYSTTSQRINLTYNGTMWYYNGTLGSTLWPGLYNVTFNATNIYNTSNTTTTNFTVNDISIPTVTSLTPAGGTNYTSGTVINISVNVTDLYYNSIDTVIANLTWDATFNETRMVYNATTALYETKLTNTSEAGRYNITIIANDTSNNINNTETSHIFVRAETTPPTIISILDYPDPVNHTQNITISANVSDNVNVSTVCVKISGTNNTMTFVPNAEEVLFSEGFETGTLTSNWTQGGIADWVASTLNPNNGTYHAQSSSGTAGESILQANISTENRTNITFSFYYSVTALDLGDYFIAEWYDGSSWVVAANYSPNITNQNLAYTLYNSTLNSNAVNNSDFSIRFKCITGAVSEACDVDDVQLTSRNISLLYEVQYDTSSLTSTSVNYTIYANDTSGNTAAPQTGNFTIVDTTPPEVIDLRPLASSSHNISTVIEVAANVTDAFVIDTVLANITYPNSTVVQITLTNLTTDKYNNSFLIPGKVGQYNVTFIANDTSNNINSTETTFFTSQPSDLIPPTWDEEPQNQTLEYGSAFYYDVNASDPSGVDVYSINDTTSFAVTPSTGIMTNATALAVNVYWLNISVNDTYANNLAAMIYVNVNDTLAPGVSINNPIAVTYNYTNISINISTSDLSSIDATWYDHNGTNTTYTTEIYYNFTDDQTYTLYAYANDTYNNLGTSSVTFTVNTSFTDPDAPLITNVTNSSITNESAYVSWNTDEPANSSISYGPDLTLGSYESNTTYSTSRNISLTGLNETTTYYYNATSCDIYGNCNTTGPYNFTTIELTPPQITDLQNETITNESTYITWTTDENANTTVNYGISISLGTYISNTTLATAHNLSLENLLEGTKYYYNATSCDTYGNCNTIGPYNFTTLDYTDPIISGVTNDTVTNETTAIIWTTDENANSTVNYGQNSSVLGSYAYDTVFNTTRSVAVSGLSPNTTYYYNVTSCDQSGNCRTSGGYNFTTIDTDPIAPVINSYSITPRIAINGSSTGLAISATDTHLDDVWAVITQPNGTHETVILSNNADTSYSSTEQVGRYNVTFYANDTSNNQASSSATYFLTEEAFTLTVFTDDYIGGSLNTTLSLLFPNTDEEVDLITIIGNSTDSNANETYDFKFTGFASNITSRFNSVVLSTANNSRTTLDRHTTITDYVVTYGVNTILSYSNVTLVISYAGTAFTNEGYLGLYKCDNYNMSNRTCAGSWYDITSNAAQSTAADTFTVTLTSLSGFSIKQETVPTTGGGGGGGYTPPTIVPTPEDEEEPECVEDWVCDDWEMCSIKGSQTRNCYEWAHCGTDTSKPATERDCVPIPDEGELIEVPTEPVKPVIEKPTPIHIPWTALLTLLAVLLVGAAIAYYPTYQPILARAPYLHPKAPVKDVWYWWKAVPEVPEKTRIIEFKVKKKQDFKKIIEFVREEPSVVFINVKEMRRWDIERIAPAVRALKKVVEAEDGDILGIGSDYIIVTSHGIKIARPGKKEEKTKGSKI